MNSLFIGRTHIWLENTSSTNAYAMELLSKSTPSDGTVISTTYQTVGKGQIDRTWYASPDKNVLCSIILYPKFVSITDQFYFNMAVACAVRSTIAHFLPQKNVHIKWPNDTYVDDKKISGILIQNTMMGSIMSSSIIGIGINVNEASFPSVLAKATSILLEQKEIVEVNVVLKALCERVEHYYLMLKNGKEHIIHSEYNSFLYRKGKVTSFQISGGTILDAIIHHVDEKGRLVVLANGEEMAFSTGNIRYI